MTLDISGNSPLPQVQGAGAKGPRTNPELATTQGQESADLTGTQGTSDQVSTHGLLAHSTDPVGPHVAGKRGLTLADARDAMGDLKKSVDDTAQWA